MAGGRILADLLDTVNIRLGGVEYFAQAATPATRADGSALVANDRWYETDSNVEWFWNGTYWLSLQEYQVAAVPGTVNTASWVAGGQNFVACSVYDVYLTRISGTIYVATTNSASHYYACQLMSQPGGSVLAQFTTAADAPNAWTRKDAAVNSFIDLTNANNAALYWNIGVALGAPGNSYISAVVAYRLAHR